MTRREITWLILGLNAGIAARAFLDGDNIGAVLCSIFAAALLLVLWIISNKERA